MSKNKLFSTAHARSLLSRYVKGCVLTGVRLPLLTRMRMYRRWTSVNEGKQSSLSLLNSSSVATIQARAMHHTEQRNGVNRWRLVTRNGGCLGHFRHSRCISLYFGVQRLSKVTSRSWMMTSSTWEPLWQTDKEKHRRLPSSHTSARSYNRPNTKLFNHKTIQPSNRSTTQLSNHIPRKPPNHPSIQLLNHTTTPQRNHAAIQQSSDPPTISPNTHTYVHTHTSKHTRTHARTHAHIHAPFVSLLLRTLVTQALTHTRTHARTHIRIHTRTHARTYARTHAHTHTRTHAHTRTRAHAHTRTHAHTHTHTHTRTHAPFVSLLSCVVQYNLAYVFVHCHVVK